MKFEPLFFESVFETLTQLKKLMKFEPLFFGRGQKEDISKKLFEDNKQLSLLKDKYSVILEQELIKARVNKRKNIKNAENYSRIAMAYYCLNILERAEERLKGIMTDRELNSCMKGMTELLFSISGFKSEVFDSKKLGKAVSMMQGDLGEENKSMTKTLSFLSKLNTEPQQGVFQDLVSIETIEKLISGELDVNSSVQGQEGVTIDPNEILSVASAMVSDDVNASETEKTEELSSMEELKPQHSIEDIMRILK